MEEFARDHVGPELARLGFRRSGLKFRRPAANGDILFVWLRSNRLGLKPLEFKVYLSIAMPVVAEFHARHDHSPGAARPNEASALWHDVLTPPWLGVFDFAASTWQLDAADAVGVSTFLDCVREKVEVTLPLLDHAALLALLRDPATKPGTVSMSPRDRAIAMLLFADGASAELSATLERLGADDMVAEWILAQLG